MTQEEIEKYAMFVSQNKKACKCGHRVLVTILNKKVICDWCGQAVYLNKKEEFKDKLKREILRKKRRKKYEK